jgi:hypothetical protein
MISIGVIKRGKYGNRLIDNIRKNSDLRISSVEIPPMLPDFIEEPGDFLAGLNLEKGVFSSDLVIAYTLHPDLTGEIIRLAGENGGRAVIFAGGETRVGNRSRLEKIAKKYNIHVEVHDICCDIEKCGHPVVDEFASHFGKPDLGISVKDGIITNVKVIRSSPCGSTWHAASGLVGININDAPARAGLLVQQYPCRALRGTKGGIHKAAQLHKEAVESAIRGIKDE